MFWNYELMWNELRAQMEELQEKKDSIDIEVLLAVMDNIELELIRNASMNTYGYRKTRSVSSKDD